MSKWIRKDDRVVVLAGNDRGRVGVILSRKGDRVVVQGVNVKKKHRKQRTSAMPAGIMEHEAPIHISNVALCNEAGQAIKLKVRQDAQGNKELFFVEAGKDVLHRQVHKHK
jgi:large subunit ribosomal protein L24